MKKFFIKNKYVILVFLITIFSLFIRYYRLGSPSEAVFDEVYYPKWAHEFLNGATPYDVHPPLVKLLIALSEVVFGNIPFAWRFFPALLGTLLVPIMYLFTLKLTKDKFLAAVSTALFSFDGLFFVLSRIGIMEIFAVFFLVLSYYLFWIYIEDKTSRKNFWLFLTGVSIGFAISTKWTDLSGLGLVLIWIFYFRKEIFEKSKMFKNIILVIINLVILPIIIYFSIFLIWYHFSHDAIIKILEWHVQAYNFHAHLKTTHPYSSYWYSWPILIRPVWYYFKEKSGVIYGIIALGNPLIWWTGITAIFWSVIEYFKNKNRALFFLLSAFLFSYLPWVLIKRIQFNYYFLPSLFFEIIILAIFLRFLSKKNVLIYVFIFLVAAMFFYFYPLLSSYPVSRGFYEMHLWFKSWI